MGFLLAIAAGLGIFLLTKKPGASAGLGGACPVPDAEMKAAGAPLMIALMGSGAKPTAANIAAARSMVRRLDMCGQNADADIIRSALFAITKDPKDVPKGPVP